ncbi:MAG: thioesterase [Proteobacteria bacterium HN_bin10]|nr:MAG: thioesterase [Proteobacteria bacterium HN_bin10]
MSDTPQQRVTAAIERIPYARFLGIRAELKGDELTLIMPFDQKLIGNPLLPALHGGVVGALMEVTALTQLAIASKSETFPKTVDINIDYLRSGRPIDTYARARVVKIGRRIANVQAEAWQRERSQPIATLHGHFMTLEVENGGVTPVTAA